MIHYQTNSTFVSGHSMGGALAVHAALEGQISGLIGLVVVDVVEGTAMDALSSMQSFLRGRPKCFPSIENAIEWSMKSGQVRNSDSARISMPGQLKNTNSNQCVAVEVPEKEPEITKNGDATSSLPVTAEGKLNWVHLKYFSQLLQEY